MQRTGIHRLDESTRRYEMQYESQSLPELVQQVHRGSVSSQEGYDVFISHASEDKAECVRPLAKELTTLGLKVWYDEFELKLGDSLRRSMDRGIATSRCGLVVCPQIFFGRTGHNMSLTGWLLVWLRARRELYPYGWHSQERRHSLLAVASRSSFNSLQLVRAEGYIDSNCRIPLGTAFPFVNKSTTDRSAEAASGRDGARELVHFAQIDLQ